MLSEQEREEYKSINGFQVIRSKKPNKIYPLELKKMFCCTISQDVAQYPVSINVSGNIYDREYILEWFSVSNIEPLTGLELDEGKIAYTPVLNFFLACLCLEETEVGLIYHPPHAEIMTLFKFAEKLFTGHFVNNKTFDSQLLSIEKSDSSQSNIQSIASSQIHLDFEDYLLTSFGTDNILKKKDKKLINLKAISLEEIMCICSITGRNMYKSSILSIRGLIIHKNVYDCSQISSANTLANFNNLYASDTKKQISIMRFDDIFHILSMDNIASDDFKVFCTSNIASDDFKVFCTSNNATQIIKYEDVGKQKQINVLNVKYDQYFDYIELKSIFTEKAKNIYFDNNHDWYLSCVSTHTLIRNKMLQFNAFDPKNIKKLVKLNEYAENNKNSIFDFVCASENPLIEMRYRILFDTFIHEDATYGSDLSYMTLSNSIYNKNSLKMFYFVGTKLNNVTFINCYFSCCVFML